MSDPRQFSTSATVKATLAHLERLLEGDEVEQRETFSELRRLIDEDRLSDRNRFSDR